MARISIDATAGALVKLTRVQPPELTISSIIRSIGARSSGGVHRYTGTGITSAPAQRSTSQKSGIGSHSVVAPCSCTAIRLPSTPSASR